jgi:hypothetical protein
LQVAAAALAEHFDKVIFKDDQDLRGRRPIEVPAFMKSCIHAINPAIPVEVIADESEAVERAVESVGSNEIVFVFIDKLSVVMNSLLKYDPQPVDAIPLVAERIPEENLYGRFDNENSYVNQPINEHREVNRNGFHS